MSLLVVESFDDDLWDKRATSVNAADTEPGRTGPFAVQPGNITFVVNWLIPAADRHATFIVGFAYKRISDTGRDDILRFEGDAGATVHITLVDTAAGALEVLRGDQNGTSLGITDSSVITVDQWHYIELYVTLSDTVGVVKLRVDGAVPAGWTDLSNVDTRNGGTDPEFSLVALNSDATQVAYDDLYIANGAGGVNDDVLGDVKVETLYPNGNGNYSNLTGSDGNQVDNYQLVDETTPDTADYVGSAVDGDEDTYTFDDLSTIEGIVYGVQASLYAAKTDAAAKSARAVARRAGTDATGDDKTLAETYDVYDQVWDTDPTDASEWTIDKVNDSEFGFEVRP